MIWMIILIATIGFFATAWHLMKGPRDIPGDWPRVPPDDDDTQV